MRLVLTGLALALSAATYVFTANNAVTAAGLAVWLLGIAAWVIVLAEQPPATRLADWRRWMAARPARARGSVRIGIGPLIALAAIMGAAAGNYHRYFIEYDDSYRRRAPNPREVARAVREVVGTDASMDGVWLQGRPFWHDYRAIGMEAGDPSFGNVIPDLSSLDDRLTRRPDRFTSRPLVFIVHPSDAAALALLERRFPHGQPRRHPGRTERRGFVLFVVPRE